MTLTKDSLKQKAATGVKSSAAGYASDVTAKADNLKTSFANAGETKVGQVAGAVTGGVESISALSKDVTGKLNAGAVEGVITDKLTGLTGGINDAGEGILTGGVGGKKTSGIKLALTWSDPDEDGNVRLEQASADVASQVDESINAVLAKVTGLNVFSGYVQKIAGNVVPKGIPSLLEKMKDGIGAFPSIDKLNELTAKANDIADTAKAGIEGAVSSVVGALPTGAGLAGDVGKNLAGALGGVADAQTKLANLGDSITGAVSGSVDEVANRITTGIGIDNTNLKDDLAAQTGKIGDDVLKSVLGGVTDDLDKLGAGRDKYDKLVGSVLSDSKTGVLQGFTQKQDQEATRILKDLAPNLTDKDRDEILALSQGTKEEKDRAIDIVAKSSGKTPAEVNASLSELNTTIAGTVLVENEESSFTDPFDLSSSENEVKTKTSKFTYISSVEELEAEFKKIVREVTEVVVHWTDTYTNKNIGSEEINESHIDLGHSSIGYHYVIRRDGSLQRGRPVNVVGDHSLINGHDQYSIGLVFVGGIQAPSGTEFAETYRSASSLTITQMNTFRDFCQAIYNRFPGAQILGHNDVDPIEQDPGFDVRDYVEDVFNKKSLFADPSSRGPFSPKELVTTQVPS